MRKLLNKKLLVIGLLAASIASVPAFAKVPAAEAEKLGKSLTVTGAEKAGNKDGSIPPYEGGITQAPSCYKGEFYVCDPFPEDKPVFTITPQNYQDHKKYLTAGHIAMLEKYSTFKMHVYPSRRSSAVPQIVAEETKLNALNAELAEGGNGVQNLASWGYPFPIPQSGVEAIWNQIMRYRGTGAKRIFGQVTPQANGSFNMVLFEDVVAFRRSLTDIKPGEDDNVLFYFRQQVKAPPRLAGNVLLVHETIDQVKEPRRAWIYNAGQRRVRRAPQVAYDGPGTAADGLRTADNFDMYNGSPDRYDWKLIGK